MHVTSALKPSLSSSHLARVRERVKLEVALIHEDEVDQQEEANCHNAESPMDPVLRSGGGHRDEQQEDQQQAHATTTNCCHASKRKSLSEEALIELFASYSCATGLSQ